MFSIRYLSLFAVFAVLLVAVEGKQRGHRFALAKKVNRFGAGQFKNVVMQSLVHTQADKMTGRYYIQNVATSGFLYWSGNPQSIVVSKSKKGTMKLSHFGAGTMIKPTASNGKCLAAQFSSVQGVDYAGTMYKCATSATKAVDAGDPQAKQQWHFIPVDGRADTYNIIPEDHLDDMITRALTSATLNTAGGYRSTAIALFDKTDEDQMWIITKA